MRIVDKLLHLAAEDSTISLLRKAPDEVIEIVKAAKPFPIEWVEVAHKKAHGTWPSSARSDTVDSQNTEACSAALYQQVFAISHYDCPTDF